MKLESLPGAADLLRRSKALACLDAILSPEWESRYYSFNAHWAPNEQMASMRNGCGDDWFMLFDANGCVGVKGYAHESAAAAHGRKAFSNALLAAVPTTMPRFANEPAFDWAYTTFVYVAELPQTAPRRLRSNTPIDELDDGAGEFLAHLIGSAADYVVFALEYFEIEIELALVEHVFALKPLSDALIAGVSPERTLAALDEDLKEIGYPTA